MRAVARNVLTERIVALPFASETARIAPVRELDVSVQESRPALRVLLTTSCHVPYAAGGAGTYYRSLSGHPSISKISKNQISSRISPAPHPFILSISYRPGSKPPVATGNRARRTPVDPPSPLSGSKTRPRQRTA